MLSLEEAQCTFPPKDSNVSSMSSAVREPVDCAILSYQEDRIQLGVYLESKSIHYMADTSKIVIFISRSRVDVYSDS